MATAPQLTKKERAAAEKAARELKTSYETTQARKAEQASNALKRQQSQQFYRDFNQRMDAMGPIGPGIQYRQSLSPDGNIPGGPDIRAMAPAENDPARAPKMIANTAPRGMDLSKPAAPERGPAMVGMGAGGPEGPSPPANYASDLLARLGNPQPTPAATPDQPTAAPTGDYASDLLSRVGSSQAPANKYVDPSAMEAFAAAYGPGKMSFPGKDNNAYFITDNDPNKAKILVHRPIPTKTGDNFNDYFVAVPLSSMKDGKFFVDGVPTSPVMKGREKVSPLSAWASANVNSATFGQGDKIAGAINATIDQVGNRYFSPNPNAPTPSWGESYAQRQGQAREFMGDARNDQPGWSTAGDVTGFLQPGAMAGKVGGKLVSPITNALMKSGSAPINLMGKVLNLGAQGAAGGAAFGYTAGAENEALAKGEESPGLLSPERLGATQTNAAYGAGFGAAMPIVAPVVRPVVNALSGVGAKIVEPIMPGAVAANNQRIATDAARRSFERSGIVTVEDFARRAAKYGDKPVMAGEMAQNTLSNLVSLTRQPGTTAEKAMAILEDRVAGLPSRLLKDIADETGLNPEEVYASLEQMVKTSRAKAAPLYEAAEAAPFAETANLERIVRDSPTLRSLYPKAVNRVQNQAVPLIGQADQMPPLKVYDELKQLVDEEITKRVANGQGIDDLEGIRKALVTELDTISAQAATGTEVPPLAASSYAAAREAGGEAPRIQAGLKAGERALQGRGVAQDIEREVAALTGQELDAYQIGVLRNIVGSVERGTLTPRRINSPDFQKRLKAVFGDPAAQGITRKFGIEAELSQKGARINPNINSVTPQVLRGGPSATGDALMQMGQSAARGNFKDALISGAANIINMVRRAGYSEEQLNAIGDILMSSPDDAMKRLFPGQAPSPGSIPPPIPPAGQIRKNPPGSPPTGMARPPRNALAQSSADTPVGASRSVANLTTPDGKVYDVKADLFTDRDAAVMSPMWPSNMAEDLSNAIRHRISKNRAQTRGMDLVGESPRTADWEAQYPEQWADAQKQVADKFVQFASSTPQKAHILALVDNIDINSLATRIEAQLPAGKTILKSPDNGELAIVDKAYLRTKPEQFQRWQTYSPSYNQRVGALPKPAPWAMDGIDGPQGPTPPPASAPKPPPVKNGFGSSKLPMDEASRMQRAREQGFDVDTPLYHGTASDFEAFNPKLRGLNDKLADDARLATFFSTSPDIASQYADEAAGVSARRRLGMDRPSASGGDRKVWDQYDTEKRDGAAVMPVYARLNNPYVVTNIREYDADAVKQALQYAEARNHDGVIFKGMNDAIRKGARPGDVYAIFDPANIRGKFAAFDPSQSGSSKLLAGFGSLKRTFKNAEEADAEFARLAKQLDDKRTELLKANTPRREAYEKKAIAELETTYAAKEREIAAKMPQWEKSFKDNNANRYEADVLADRADDYAYAMYNRETAKLDKWRDRQEEIINDKAWKLEERLDAQIEKWHDAQYDELYASFEDIDVNSIVGTGMGVGLLTAGATLPKDEKRKPRNALKN